MEPKTYDGQTAKLIAKIAENFPRVSSPTMQHCIDNIGRLMRIVEKQLERDAVFRYGIWMSLPKDTQRIYWDAENAYVDDRRCALLAFGNTLKTSRCWDDYWWAEGIDDKKTEGLITRWAKLPFAAERLIKIPVAHFPSRPGPHAFEGTQECSIEAAARVMLLKKGFAPGERVCFFCRLKGGDGRHDGSHFCISTAWNGDAELSVVHEANMSDFTHIVFAERSI